MLLPASGAVGATARGPDTDHIDDDVAQDSIDHWGSVTSL